MKNKMETTIWGLGLRGLGFRVAFLLVCRDFENRRCGGPLAGACCCVLRLYTCVLGVPISNAGPHTSAIPVPSSC